MQILKRTGVDKCEKIFISMLYMDQSVKVRLDQGETRSVKIGRGVRQGCCLSPIVLSLCREYLTKEYLEGFADFKIGVQILCNLKYADDLVLLAEEEMVLQDTIERLIDARRSCGMEMNVGMKNEVMRFSRQLSLFRIMID
jgi:hypothetical protein